MTKHDISRRVAFESEVAMAWAARVVQRVLDSITESLATGGSIELRGYGVFDVVMTEGRIARNPRTGEKLVGAPKARVRVAMGKEMGES